MLLPIGLEFVAVFIATLLMIWALEPMAHRLGLLDHPAGRKQHEAPTPFHGGLAIFIGMLVMVALIPDPSPRLQALVLAGGLLVVVGVLDDLYDVHWTWRILAQIAAALILVHVGGVRIEQIGPVFGLAPMSLGQFSVPFTVFATVGLINALNMADGIDGLAGSLVLAALLMLAGAAAWAGNERLLHGLVLVAGAVLAFLVFNLRRPGLLRARVFLGNAGSALLGLVIAWAAFRLTQNPGHPVSPVLAPFLIAPPVIDCLVLIARRLRMGRSPFAADRGHMHHHFLDAGFGVGGTVLVITSASLVLGGLAAIALLLKLPQQAFVGVFLGLCVGWYALTAKRSRAVGVLGRLRALLAAVPVVGHMVSPPPRHQTGATTR